MSDNETPKPQTFLWNRLRKSGRKKLDEMERDLIFRPAEKRQFAGDPRQPRVFWVRTQNKK